jgi:hypothetical protein
LCPIIIEELAAHKIYLEQIHIEACMLLQVRNWITLKCSVQFQLHISETQPDLYLDELKEELELEGMSISLVSLCQYLHRNGVTHKRVRLLRPHMR